jgi:hypothetical protein
MVGKCSLEVILLYRNHEPSHGTSQRDADWGDRDGRAPPEIQSAHVFPLDPKPVIVIWLECFQQSEMISNHAALENGRAIQFDFEESESGGMALVRRGNAY